MGRHLHTGLDLLKPDVRKNVQKYQMRKKEQHDGSANMMEVLEFVALQVVSQLW